MLSMESKIQFNYESHKPNKILALDVSTKTGWAFFVDNQLVEKGLLTIDVKYLDLNGNPDKAPEYPINFLNSSKQMIKQISALVDKLNPDVIVIENTVLSRNRHAQRLLEFLHYDVIDLLHFNKKIPFFYMNPSEWRKQLDMRLTQEDKIKNKDVKKGKIKGKITKKHLSVRFANETFKLSLLQKDNDIADAINLGLAYYISLQNGY